MPKSQAELDAAYKARQGARGLSYLRQWVPTHLLDTLKAMIAKMIEDDGK